MQRITLVLSVLVLAGLLGATPSARPTAVDAGPPPSAGAVPGATGQIEGRLRLAPVRQRRAAARYPAGDPSARPIQQIPALVFLRGPAGDRPGAAAAVMGQEDHRFEPSLVVVPVGSVVRFPNHDPIFHNVFSYSSPARFDLGRYPKGESREVRFDEPGIVRVYCEVHESMRAAVVVVENGFWAVPDVDGRFTINGVPAGRHTLVAWHADRGEREVELTVPSAGTVRVELDL